MPDDIILPGIGSTVATDDVGGKHIQVMKLAASADGSAEALSKAEDSVHSSGQHGLMALGVRKDAPQSLGASDGRYVPPTYDGRGRLYVSTPDQQLLTKRHDIQEAVIYVGTAPRGTTTASTGWTIKRVQLDGDGDPTSEMWTDEGAAIWDNRSSETYT